MTGAGRPAAPRNLPDCDGPIRRRRSAANSGAAAALIFDPLTLAGIIEQLSDRYIP